eukprot:2511035-Prymnesium_polylepis.1
MLNAVHFHFELLADVEGQNDPPANTHMRIGPRIVLRDAPIPHRRVSPPRLLRHPRLSGVIGESGSRRTVTQADVWVAGIQCVLDDGRDG